MDPSPKTVFLILNDTLINYTFFQQSIHLCIKKITKFSQHCKLIIFYCHIYNKRKCNISRTFQLNLFLNVAWVTS